MFRDIFGTPAKLCRMIFVERFQHLSRKHGSDCVGHNEHFHCVKESCRVHHRIFDVCGRSKKFHHPHERLQNSIVVQTVHVNLSQVLMQILEAIHCAQQEHIASMSKLQMSQCCSPDGFPWAYRGTIPNPVSVCLCLGICKKKQ